MHLPRLAHTRRVATKVLSAALIAVAAALVLAPSTAAAADSASDRHRVVAGEILTRLGVCRRSDPQRIAELNPGRFLVGNGRRARATRDRILGGEILRLPPVPDTIKAPGNLTPRELAACEDLSVAELAARNPGVIDEERPDKPIPAGTEIVLTAAPAPPQKDELRRRAERPGAPDEPPAGPSQHTPAPTRSAPPSADTGGGWDALSTLTLVTGLAGLAVIVLVGVWLGAALRRRRGHRAPGPAQRRGARRSRSLPLLLLGGGALALLAPSFQVVGGLLIACAGVETLRPRLIGLSDGRRRALIGVTARGASAAFGAALTLTYTVQIGPRPLARQLGLPQDSPAVGWLYGFTVGACAVPLLASLTQRWWPSGWRGTSLCWRLLALGSVGLVAIPFTSSATSLYVAVAIGSLSLAGAIMLQCKVAAAAAPGAERDSVVAKMLAPYVIVVCAAPLCAGFLADVEWARIGRVSGFGLTFIILGTIVWAGLRLLRPLMPSAYTGGSRREAERGLDDVTLWRAIAFTTLTISGLGPIDAGMPFVMTDHGVPDRWAETGVAILLLSSLLVLPLSATHRGWRRETGEGVGRYTLMIRHHPWASANVPAMLALLAAVLGWSAMSLEGARWALSFAGAYVVFDPMTTLIYSFALYVALKNPANFARAALVTGIRLGSRALSSLAYFKWGESGSWWVAIACCALALAVVLPPWRDLGERPGQDRQRK